MKIMVNGETFEIEQGWSIANLIDHFDLPRKKLAIERNLEIVPKSAYDEICLADGDRLEIVHFIGGG
ncbi:MAG: sulfur carrier protein ThiS [Parvibaculales bacterium]